MADGTPAQFSNNSYGTGQFIAKLYNTAEKAPEFNQGLIPVVSVTSSTPLVVGKGTSFDLGFTIKKWVAAPVEGDAPAAPAPAPAAAQSDDAFGF